MTSHTVLKEVKKETMFDHRPKNSNICLSLHNMQNAAFALPTADYVGVFDTSGDQGTYVVVPAVISEVQNGPIISTVFDACYDKSVIEVVNVQNGDLITSRNDPAFNGAFAWGTRVSLVYQGETVQGL